MPSTSDARGRDPCTAGSEHDRGDGRSFRGYSGRRSERRGEPKGEDATSN